MPANAPDTGSRMPTDRDLLDEFEAERPGRTLSGVPALLAGAAGIGLSLFAVYWVLQPMSAGTYRATFLTVALALTFLTFRARGRRSRVDQRAENPTVVDWLLAIVASVVVGYAALNADEIFRRAAVPESMDLVMGAVTILLILEATRRTVGWMLPAICIVFLAYAYFGALIPEGTGLAHSGYALDRIVSQSYMGLEGIFGTPLAVAATYIVLFSVYGAVLEYSGAGRFFVELASAAFGRRGSAPGRTTVLAGFLLGTVSGSGVATTVTLGSVTWPMLRKSGYPKVPAGGVLAASGIGALLSPPTLGAAAFIIAELLGVSYLQVLLWAIVPTVLYYLGILLAIEIDARRHGIAGGTGASTGFWRLLVRWGYHFSSLFVVVGLLIADFTPFRAVLYATAVAFLMSFLDRRDRMGPRKVADALAAGARGVLPVAATCAAAGVVVAVLSLTGLGFTVSSRIVDVAGGSLLLTAILSAVAVLVVGLAVPVTASFIVAAVVIAPALTALGVPEYVAYMFIFYYAVLSEVTPPTATAAFAAAAITGGSAFRTVFATFRYSLPAFLVPFAFVLSPNGEALLLQDDAATVVWALAASALAVACLAVALGGWLWGPVGPAARVVATVGALLLLDLEPLYVGIGLALAIAAVALQVVQRATDRNAALPAVRASSE